MTDGRLDELARSLARPVSRRSALRLVGSALVAAGASGLLPSRGLAGDDDPCPTCADRPGSLPCCVRFGNGLARVAIGQCYYPGTEQCCTGPSAYDGYPTAWICSKYDKCGADGADLCIGQCHTEDGDVSIDFETECCTPSGIEPKYEGFSLKACKDTLTKRKGYRGPTVNGCGTDRIKLPNTLNCRGSWGNRKLVVRQHCNEHDRCYGTCGKDKDECDRQLIKQLEAACKDKYPDSTKFSKCRENCVDLAYSASIVLRTHNEPERAYKEAQEKACQCCP